MKRAFVTSEIAMSRCKLLTDFKKRIIKYGAAGTGPTLAQNRGQQVTSSNLIQYYSQYRIPKSTSPTGSPPPHNTNSTIYDDDAFESNDPKIAHSELHHHTNPGCTKINCLHSL